MIKDKLTNASTYYLLSENIKKGLVWLQSQDLKNLPCNKYTIEDNELYANIQEYETKDDANYEAHRKYIDIQYMISGKEFVGVAPLDACSTCEKYNSGNDVEFLSCDEKNAYQTLNEGEFLILFPHDAHKPCINPNKKQTVKKVVVKVAL